MDSQHTELLDLNYSSTGFATKLGYGIKPALLLIDLAEAYFREGTPLYHPRFRPALESCVRLQEQAHTSGIPVILTRVEVSKGGVDCGIFFKKITIPMLCFEEGNPLGDFNPLVKVGKNDVVVTKRYPSSFFATPLGPMLTSMGVDTVIIGGVSTSGCVRASALDTCQWGFRPIVVSEACGDRHQGPHDANLFDINAKYGDVVSEADAMNYMANLGRKA
ncbi:isochorismatase family protein [Rhizobium lusitanum]|uniref:isochorismatase family protein n=1 Tax=Rhizobium lusitanum TaxID=293958 RepID=UPI001574DF5B|nr:isochorismatase family protein [Rhizobium lusitanum]NTJ11577.1 isochorismatase family protein [Rhizobium lusitanum]